MDELIPVELDNHPTEANQKTVPIPAKAKNYIFHIIVSALIFRLFWGM